MGAERIHVHQSFSNVLFEVDEEVAFSRAQISLLGLAYWVMETGLEESMTFKEEKAGNITDIAHQIKISHVPDVKFTGPDGENLRFSHTYTMGGDRRTELRFTQDFKFVVEPDSLRAPGEYMKVSSALQDLLTIAIGRPSVLREVVFRHPDTKRVLGEKEYYPPIVSRAQWAVRPAKRKKPLSQNDVIFNLDDFGGPEKVTKWLEVAGANRSTLSRVMATKYSVDMFAGDLFFSCAAALEAYDRTMFADDIYYVDRLKRCAQRVGAPFTSLVCDVDSWATLVKKNRNTVAHHNAEIADATTAQIVLGRSAFWLYVFCLLRDVDAPEVVFEKLSDQPSFDRLTSDLAGVLAAP
ncbi:hypothetical protein AUQ48_12455 [Kocuria flava]|uniref:ApeA N-terminal domain-containing protein n=1 Tax=Kocuria flava TaxID=446860 RepID=A0A2N4T3T3_9MICC|nr:HEPN domain-containing protein [Kocuria flava]PLC12891.1 hypothetical protein AUQ48_12455 [Kocuria flava]